MSDTFANYMTLLKLTKQKVPVIMMCYKDRTWCVHSRECSNTSCDRNLNEDEIKQATEWWGDRNFPVAKADFKTDDCGYSQIDAARDENVESTDA